MPRMPEPACPRAALAALGRFGRARDGAVAIIFALALIDLLERHLESRG